MHYKELRQFKRRGNVNPFGEIEDPSNTLKKQDVMLSQAQHDNGVIVYLSESKKNDINSAVSVNSLNTAEKIK